MILNASFECNFLAKCLKPKGAGGVVYITITSKNLMVFSINPVPKWCFGSLQANVVLCVLDNFL